jgi:alkanesulfonate monooxygenase SsuD/methylene tetrahydromethanopterin reductase-like flavin-dependent oxidoreductase (luciferase family)
VDAGDRRASLDQGHRVDGRSPSRTAIRSPDDTPGRADEVFRGPDGLTGEGFVKSLILHFDLRAPEFAPPVEVTPIEELYEAALDMCAWADDLGFHAVNLSCHHGSDDNYCPSMSTFAAAIAARTRSINITVPVTLPFYDPLQVAEEFAVLDIVSRGRVRLLGVGGYVDAEYDLFGVPRAERGARMDEAVATLKKAWTGERFSFRGRDVMVRPRPLHPGQPALYLGGDSVPAARRAARAADGYLAVHGGPSWDAYAAECEKLGIEPAPVLGQNIQPAMYLQVAKDPDAMAAAVEPYLLHVSNSYAKWMADAGISASYSPAASVAELRSSGNFQILTPSACLEYVASCEEILLDPLFGGMPPAIGWESLKLFATEVMPHLDLRARPGDR